MINHEDITLNNINKLLDFEIMSREIDEVNDLETLRNVAKGYIKLFLKNQEMISEFGFDDYKDK